MLCCVAWPVATLVEIQVPDSSSTAAGAVGRRAGEGGGSAKGTHTHTTRTPGRKMTDARQSPQQFAKKG